MVIWGLSPVWAKKPMNLINARIETLNQKPAFKETKPFTGFRVSRKIN